MAETEKMQHILDYWHKIEFFIPFDLKQVLEHANEDEDNLRWISQDDLTSGAPSLWNVEHIREGHELVEFQLYLGVFDMQAIVEFANGLSQDSSGVSSEDDERTALDGQSCVARLKLNAHGEPVFDPFSVSTVPWAIGTAGRDGLDALGSTAFELARRDLSERLFNFEAERRRRRSDVDDDGRRVPLTGEELSLLRDLLLNWAGCEWQAGSSVALVEIVTREKRTKAEPRKGDPGAAKDGARTSKSDAAAQHDDDGGDDEDAQADAPTVDILNSFYIEDIERCMRSVDAGNVPATLRAYLMPGAARQRIDLYSDTGRAEIIRALHPAKMNAGHWPEDASRKMSLMQQFAINTAFERLEEDGLFSVNGPPGTGKTTLLRDMVSENVVRRARRLAALRNAADALMQTGTGIPFADGKTPTIFALRPELTGFEMVVVSSNNAAVENISRDLPKRRRLGDEWRHVHYLQSVAHKIAAQVGEKRFATLDPLDVPWGLVSCALGNADNRRRFKERFFFDNRPVGERGGPNGPQTIWAWRDQYSGPTFQAAKAAFLDADAAYRTAVDERSAYAALHAKWSDVTEQQFTRPAADRRALAERDVREAAAAREQCGNGLREADVALAELKEEERLLDRARPRYFSRLFRTEAARRHAEHVARNAREQIDARKRVARCRTAVAAATETERDAQSRAEQANAELISAREAWSEQNALLEQGKRQFGEMDLPVAPEQIESDPVQRNGFWQNPEFMRLRSGLFVAALTLHESWLAEVSKKGGGFGRNLSAIGTLLSGKPLENPADAALIWQSLFMVVPVVSSTFASFARQFRGMGPGSIGWLFIDEAGQAVPQAAAGALWRARRAVVVGDPLQIEPVFTVPTRLINALANVSPHTSDGRCSPARVSVQRLADDANPYGTYVPVEGEAPLWIGSPLRVHRRCADPMFSIANRIAYHDKMVYGPESSEPPDDPFNLGKSAWVDVRGKTSKRQAVRSQIEVVAELVTRLYADHGVLPPLYVISPFKAVKKELLNRLQRIDWSTATRRRGPEKKVWTRWCEQRIGTVHTFQGKEESVVVFVLGADHDSAASANWAASKPNLLNVAATRAQHRLFVVGDASLWAGLKYFSDARSKLEGPISAAQWLGRIGEASRRQMA
ncbi:hypothetical protein WI73_08540 [Burkholderia ubonensis]|uniref:DEAD/DEAH box helicase n=1 Tax=Burkholderia ubonensis TaxID=101571 RepID=UPI000758E9F8|nr:DEAD/DEAH box helicase [Burkholderia ubonensis]KUZ90328.1 hypothetical protein WI40_27795 [Burkholderia ubonensis]KVC73816.1 hypothetical protein WI73_08540 [Burkholderia ubonensis]